MSRKATPESHPEREEFLTARQLAGILQVSESTVRRLAQKGRIPSIRLSSRLLRFHLPKVRKALDGASNKRAGSNSAELEDDLQLPLPDLL